MKQNGGGSGTRNHRGVVALCTAKEKKLGEGRELKERTQALEGELQVDEGGKGQEQCKKISKFKQERPTISGGSGKMMQVMRLINHKTAYIE